MKVLIHIGTEKTGTTSIQSFFNANREKLQHLGIAYLRSIGHTNNRKLATYCIGLDRSDDAIAALGIETKAKRQQWQGRILSEFRSEVKNLPSNIQTIVISSEHFHSRLIKKEEIETLKAVVSEITDDIEIVVFIRSQVEMAISLHSTALKVGQYNSSILPQGNLVNSIYYNYEKLLKLWSEVFSASKINVKLFERAALLNGNLIDELLFNTLAITNASGLVYPAQENESISPIGQKLLNSINQHFRDREDLKLKLRRYIEDNYSGKGAYPSEAEYYQFQSQFSEGNCRVAQKWFNKNELFKIVYPPNQTLLSAKYSEQIVNDLIRQFRSFF